MIDSDIAWYRPFLYSTFLHYSSHLQKSIHTTVLTFRVYVCSIECPPVQPCARWDEALKHNYVVWSALEYWKHSVFVVRLSFQWWFTSLEIITFCLKWAFIQHLGIQKMWAHIKMNSVALHFYFSSTLELKGIKAVDIASMVLMQEMARRSTHFCEKACAGGLIGFLLFTMKSYMVSSVH